MYIYCVREGLQICIGLQKPKAWCNPMCNQILFLVMNFKSMSNLPKRSAIRILQSCNGSPDDVCYQHSQPESKSKTIIDWHWFWPNLPTLIEFWLQHWCAVLLTASHVWRGPLPARGAEPASGVTQNGRPGSGTVHHHFPLAGLVMDVWPTLPAGRSF